MSNLTSVSITSGVPSGTGTVSTIDALMADGGQATLGTKADAKASTSDATPITAMSVWKQISFSIQAAATSLASLVSGAITPGTAGSATSQVLTVQGIASMTPVAVSGTVAATSAASASLNGQTSSRVNAAASTNATSLKTSAGNIGEIDVFNNAAYAVFLKLYNKASAPTVGTDTPVWTIPVAAGGGFSKSFPRGKSFATGIAYAITKLQADSDTTVVVAGDLTGSIDWI